MAARRVTLTIDSEPADIRLARDFATRAATYLFPDIEQDTLRLVVSELVGNAVALDAGPVTVTVGPLDDTTLRIEVRDDGWGQPEMAAAAGLGRGLKVVDELAEQWGVSQFLPGKIVWADLACGRAPRRDGRRDRTTRLLRRPPR